MTNINVKPVIDAVIQGEGETHCLPFYSVTVTKDGAEKTIFTNFTFCDTDIAAGRVVFENWMGPLKNELFGHLDGLSEHRMHLLCADDETMDLIHEKLGELQDRSAVLFVFPRVDGLDDSPFYRALGLADTQGKIIKPSRENSLNLREVGLSPRPPFMSLTTLEEAQQ